jgi:hypothetical protein
MVGIGAVRSKRSDTEAASGQPDRCVRSAQVVPLLDPNGSICFGVYKYMVAGSWGTLLALWHTWHPCEPKQTPPTHLHPWFIMKVRLGVIPSIFAWVIASSGTWRSLWLRSSYYSWRLPPPRRLGVAEELWQELVIVLDHLPVIIRGSCAFPDGAPKATLMDCACHWATSLVGRFLQCPSGTRFVQHLLTAKPPSVGRHNRD